MSHCISARLSAIVFLGSASFAQDLRFPCEPLELDVDQRVVRWEPRVEAVRSLLQYGYVRLRDVLLPDGELVDVDLWQIDLGRRRFGIQVDGVPAPELLDSLDLSVWKGTVVGEPNQPVRLAFSNAGCHGWIRRGADTVHLLNDPDEGEVWFVLESELRARGGLERAPCSTANRSTGLVPDEASLVGGNGSVPGGCTMRDCKIAVETDTELYENVFGSNLNAETVYVLTLLSYVSDVYENQVDTVLTFPYVQFYTGPDPWDTDQDALDFLLEFTGAWKGNIPGGAQLGHFLSGELQGGIAWIDSLCDPDWAFAVCGEIDGQTPFPPQVGPLNHDFKIVAHELGHNFGSPHTHDYCPPLDQCYWGLCNDQLIQSPGTIMSYCDLDTLELEFHPEVAALITDRANACLPLFSGIEGDAPAVIPEGQPTQVSAHVVGFPAGDVDLFYRYDAGNFQSVAMNDQGGGIYTAFLPAPECDDVPHFYYGYTDVTCGGVTDPEESGGMYVAEVGELVPLLVDDFEADLGWTVENGAIAGWWERGVPVDDFNYNHDPWSDYDGSGQCFLTWNDLGETDVDFGTVRLISPELDFSDGLATISYAYFLCLEEYLANDALTVEVSSNGLAGPWTQVVRHDENRGVFWWTHTITSTDLQNAGVNNTATMRLRFSANDSGPQSIVEAALDAVRVDLLVCHDTIGDNYCDPGVINSTGLPGTIQALGSAVVSDNDVTLSARQLPPHQFGYFLVSQTQGFVPNPGGSQGNLCLGGGIGRYREQVTSSGAAGRIDLAIDLTDVPTPNQPAVVQPGETWNFQCWHRDVVAAPTSNLTNGVSITFL